MATLKFPVSILAIVAVVGGAIGLQQQWTLARLHDGIDALPASDSSLALARQTNRQLTQGAQAARSLRAARAAAESDLSRLQARADAHAAKSRGIRPASAPKAALQGETYDISQLDQIPVAKAQVRPQYPLEMRRAGSSGQVLVEFVVDAQGNVQNPIAASSSRPEFEEPAIEAVSQWNFSAGLRQGKAVNTRMQVPIVFSVAPEDTSWF